MNISVYRTSIYLQGFMSLLHSARVRENVLLHARSYRLTVYSSENSHRHLSIKGLAE